MTFGCGAIRTEKKQLCRSFKVIKCLKTIVFSFKAENEDKLTRYLKVRPGRYPNFFFRWSYYANHFLHCPNVQMIWMFLSLVITAMTAWWNTHRRTHTHSVYLSLPQFFSLRTCPLFSISVCERVYRIWEHMWYGDIGSHSWIYFIIQAIYMQCFLQPDKLGQRLNGIWSSTQIHTHT